MSGCGTRIVLRGQKPLALCDRCPCFGSLFPPLAALTFAASSIICAFGLASAVPRSPYRHLELCGIAINVICRGRCLHRPGCRALPDILLSGYRQTLRWYTLPPTAAFPFRFILIIIRGRCEIFNILCCPPFKIFRFSRLACCGILLAV